MRGDRQGSAGGGFTRIMIIKSIFHSEPGAPFFPTTEEEAKQLTLEAIPLAGPITIRAGVGVGAGGLILEHARKLTANQPSATGGDRSHGNR